MPVTVTRDQFIAEARTWIGTPFQDKGRRKGQGLDCVGIVLCTGHDLGINDKNGVPFTRDMYTDYSSQPTGNFVHLTCCKHLIAKAVPAMRAGDVVTMAVPSAPCHVGVIGDSPNGLTLIHAYAGGGSVCMEHVITPQWKRRIVGCFQMPNVE